MQACQYITNHSEAEVVVVENKTQLAKYLQVSDQVSQEGDVTPLESGAGTLYFRQRRGCSIRHMNPK